MLENSGLVLGVDSSLGLLTRLHNPWHVGVALLVHGWLLHLTQTETEKERKQREDNRRARLVPMLCVFSVLTMLHMIALMLYFFRM